MSIFLKVLISVGVFVGTRGGALYAAEEVTYSKAMSSDCRTAVLSKIYANIYDSKDSIFLGQEVKQLISIYKNYLEKLEKNTNSQEKTSLLVDNVRMLLGQLEKGVQHGNDDSSQMVACYDLITTIESILYKLENSYEFFDATALPLEKIAAGDPYKKLQGEKLPGKINKRKSSETEAPIELSPLPLSQIKIISFTSHSNSVEEGFEDR